MDKERDLIHDPLQRQEIEELVRIAGGIEPLLSKKSTKFKAYQAQVMKPDDWIEFMVQEPRLLRRPLVFDGVRLYIGFDEGNWSKIPESAVKSK